MTKPYAALNAFDARAIMLLYSGLELVRKMFAIQPLCRLLPRRLRLFTSRV